MKPHPSSRIEILETRIAPATLDVVAGALSYVSGAGEASTIVLSINGSDEYVINDDEPLTLGTGAIAAGFVNVNATIVRGPNSAVTSLTMNLGDLNDTLNVQGLTDPLSVNGATGADTIIVENPVTVNGALSLQAETITIDGSISGATDVTLDADTLAVNAAVNLTGTAIVRPDTSARPVNLGTETAGSLSLTDAELDQFVGATLLRIGSKVTGTITLSAAITSGLGALSLQSDAGLTQTGAGAITVAALSVNMDASALFTAASDVDTLAVNLGDAGADFSFADPDGFQIGTVDGVTGLETSTDAGSFIALNGGAVTQAAGAAIVSGGLRLSGDAFYTLTDPANDVGTLAANPTGGINFTDANALTVGTVNGVNGAISSNGDVRLTTLAGDLTISNGNGSPAPDIFAGDDVFLKSGVAGNDFGITLAANAGISADNEIALTADAISISAAINSTSSTVSFFALEDATTIALGGVDAAGVLGLSTAELDLIVSTGLVIASPDLNPITVTGTISPVGIQGFLLLGGSEVSGTGGIVVAQLDIRSVGNVSLNGANDVDGLSFQAGGNAGPIVNFTDADGFTLNTNDFVASVFTLATFTGSTITLAARPLITLGGTTPGTDQSQIAVVGNVVLAGGLTLAAVGTPAQGTEFVLISNDGTDAVSGTFTGLPEGAPLTVGGVAGTISYVGGDGNDVVFTTLPGLTITLANGGKTATFRDLDGDLVTVKTTKGAFDGSEFLGIADGVAGGGQLLRLALDADFTGADITLTAKRTAEGGNGFVNVGFLDATGVDLGAVTIAGDLGRIKAGTAGGDAKVPGLKALTAQSVGLLGASTQPAGGDTRTSVIEGTVLKLTVAGDVRKSNFRLNGADARLGAVTLGGSLIGDGDDNSVFTAPGGIGTVKIGGDIRHGAGTVFGNSGFTSDGAIGSISVKGSIVGASTSGVIIQAFGQTAAPSKGVDTALKSLTVGGSVEALAISVGTHRANADASIGSISVGGDWLASSVTAGTATGADNRNGTADDAKVTGGRDNPAIFSTIGSFTVKGQALGTTTLSNDMFGVVAERIGKAKVGGRTFAFAAGATPEAFFAAPTGPGAGAENPAFDFTIRELGSTTPVPAFGGSSLTISTDGKTATYVDVDGDLVTVKRSAGTFTAGDFNIADNAAGGGQLGVLNVTPAPGGAAFDLSLKAKPGPAGGNGFVNVGAINAASVTLGTVSIVGDVGGFFGGVVTPGGFGVKSFTAHSMRALGSSTGSALVNTVFVGGAGKVVVQADSHDAEFRATGAGGRFGSVTVGGFVEAPSFGSFLLAEEGVGSVVIGGSVNRAQIVVTKGALGTVTIGGSLIGDPSKASISAFGQLAPPAKGIDLAIKSLTVKGGVENARIEVGVDSTTNADAAIGAISVGRAWIASSVTAGANDGVDNFLGTADDAKLTGAGVRDAATRFSTIASIVIKGQALGSAATGDSFGIVAEVIGKAQVGAVKFAFDKGERDAADAFALAPTGPGPAPDNAASDFFVREITV